MGAFKKLFSCGKKAKDPMLTVGYGSPRSHKQGEVLYENKDPLFLSKSASRIKYTRAQTVPPPAREAAFHGPPRFDWIDIVRPDRRQLVPFLQKCSLIPCASCLVVKISNSNVGNCGSHQDPSSHTSFHSNEYNGSRRNQNLGYS